MIEDDPWIPRVGNVRPLAIKEDLKGHKVNSLLDENNQWKEDIIQQSFLPQEVEYILNILTGDKETNDGIFGAQIKKVSLQSKALII